MMMSLEDQKVQHETQNAGPLLPQVPPIRKLKVRYSGRNYKCFKNRTLTLSLLNMRVIREPFVSWAEFWDKIMVRCQGLPGHFSRAKGKFHHRKEKGDPIHCNMHAKLCILLVACRWRWRMSWIGSNNRWRRPWGDENWLLLCSTKGQK